MIMFKIPKFKQFSKSKTIDNSMKNMFKTDFSNFPKIDKKSQSKRNTDYDDVRLGSRPNPIMSKKQEAIYNWKRMMFPPNEKVKEEYVVDNKSKSRLYVVGKNNIVEDDDYRIRNNSKWMIDHSQSDKFNDILKNDSSALKFRTSKSKNINDNFKPAIQHTSIAYSGEFYDLVDSDKNYLGNFIKGVKHIKEKENLSDDTPITTLADDKIGYVKDFIVNDKSPNKKHGMTKQQSYYTQMLGKTHGGYLAPKSSGDAMRMSLATAIPGEQYMNATDREYWKQVNQRKQISGEMPEGNKPDDIPGRVLEFPEDNKKFEKEPQQFKHGEEVVIGRLGRETRRKEYEFKQDPKEIRANERMLEGNFDDNEIIINPRQKESQIEFFKRMKRLSKDDDSEDNKKVIGYADGKPVIKLSGKGYPDVSTLNNIYKKIPDDKKVPVVLETRENYLKEYTHNQEKLKGIKFSQEEKDRYMREELEKLKPVTARFTTYHNKWIPARVVLFPGKTNKKEVEANVLHEFGHEVEEKNPKLAKEWNKKINKKTSPTLYGTTDKDEDFAESFTLYKNPKLIPITNPNTNKEELNKRFNIIHKHLGNKIKRDKSPNNKDFKEKMPIYDNDLGYGKKNYYLMPDTGSYKDIEVFNTYDEAQNRRAKLLQDKNFLKKIKLDEDNTSPNLVTDYNVADDSYKQNYLMTEADTGNKIFGDLDTTEDNKLEDMETLASYRNMLFEQKTRNMINDDTFSGNMVMVFPNKTDKVTSYHPAFYGQGVRPLNDIEFSRIQSLKNDKDFMNYQNEYKPQVNIYTAEKPTNYGMHLRSGGKDYVYIDKNMFNQKDDVLKSVLKHEASDHPMYLKNEGNFVNENEVIALGEKRGHTIIYPDKSPNMVWASGLDGEYAKGEGISFATGRDYTKKRVLMSPNDVLRRQYYQAKTPDTFEDWKNFSQKSRIDSIKKGLVSKKVEVPVVIEEYNKQGEQKDFQEGRHRALAAKELGYKTMPVILARKKRDEEYPEYEPKITEAEKTKTTDWDVTLEKYEEDKEGQSKQVATIEHCDFCKNNTQHYNHICMECYKVK